ncbi:MAG: hypothetical protein V1918_09785 [Planctomycetota bacterium]
MGGYRRLTVRKALAAVALAGWGLGTALAAEASSPGSGSGRLMSGGFQMGEVATLAGKGASRQGSNPGETEGLHVGDALFSGETVRTGGATLEIFLGTYARLWLGPDSTIELLDQREETEAAKTLLRRRILFHNGVLRLRVRENTVRPEPVLLFHRSVELDVGCPEMAVPGGVEILLESHAREEAVSADTVKGVASPRGEEGRTTGGDEEPPSVATVLNGSILVTRPRAAGRPQTETLTLRRGEALTIPMQKAPRLPDPRPLAAEDEALEAALQETQKRCAFSTEDWGRESMPPPRYNRELDGP